MGGCSSLARERAETSPVRQSPTLDQGNVLLGEAEIRKILKKRLGECCISDFEVGKTLGKGSCGTVRLAKHMKSGKQYAVKILSIEQESDLNQAMNELQIMLLVDVHPNIIRLEGVSRVDKTQYLIQEYAEGGDVFTLLRKLKRFNAASAQFYIAQTVSQRIPSWVPPALSLLPSSRPSSSPQPHPAVPLPIALIASLARAGARSGAHPPPPHRLPVRAPPRAPPPARKPARCRYRGPREGSECGARAVGGASGGGGPRLGRGKSATAIWRRNGGARNSRPDCH